MNRLQAELRRLYFSLNAEEPGLTDPDAPVRAMVLALARPAQWDRLSAVWQGVQADLELPAPAIAVSGIDGHQLWFSLAESVPVAQAMAFLEALRARYLGDIAPERVDMQPAVEASAPGQEQQGSGHWSAFVVPGLAPMFADEPWLDLPPSPDAQADLLSRFKSTSAADWSRALERLQPAARTTAPPPASGAAEAAPGDLDPTRFLRSVMNDPAVALHLRIDAAKALLPYSQGRHNI